MKINGPCERNTHGEKPIRFKNRLSNAFIPSSNIPGKPCDKRTRAIEKQSINVAVFKLSTILLTKKYKKVKQVQPCPSYLLRQLSPISQIKLEEL